MAQAPGTGITALARGFGSLGNTQKLGLLAALAAAIALVAVAFLWARTSEYRVLYSNLSDRDGGEVLAALSQQNVPYRVAEGGSVILVPAGQVYELRLKLAAQGLPKGGAVGFELMDGQKFGISQFAEQVNYQRALAGELSRTVQSMAAVQAARVHLAIPRPTVFVRDQQHPSASVLVSLYPGRVLDAGQVNAIQHLVASSVPELEARNVTVVDQSGNLLSGTAMAAAPGVNGLDAAQLKYLHAVEASLCRAHRENPPAHSGNGQRARAGHRSARLQSGRADLRDVQAESRTARGGCPQPADGGDDRPSTRKAPSGVPGALSNQPPGAASSAADHTGCPAPAAGAGPAGANTHRENIVNYEVDKTIRHTKAKWAPSSVSPRRWW